MYMFFIYTSKFFCGSSFHWVNFDSATVPGVWYYFEDIHRKCRKVTYATEQQQRIVFCEGESNAEVTFGKYEQQTVHMSLIHKLKILTIWAWIINQIYYFKYCLLLAFTLYICSLWFLLTNLHYKKIKRDSSI